MKKFRGFAAFSKERLLEVSRKGGSKTSSTHDMKEIGRKGGKVTAKRGSEYFSRIGRLGGQKSKRGKANGR